MNTPINNRSMLLPIFLTVFIDMLGVGIIIPVIPPLFFNETNSILPAATSDFWRSMLYGLLVASYPFMQFFGSPILGSLSDRYGRRPLLLVSLVGTAIGYLLFASAINIRLLPLLFISRMLPGFTGGNISIIMSAISDISTPQERAQNFGLVGVSFGLGFILGPALGGILASNSMVSWFSNATPFYFTALLTVLNIILLQKFFKETLTQKKVSRVSLFTGFQNIFLSFKLPHLRTIFTVSLLSSLGFTFFSQFFSVYLLGKFHYTEQQTGILYAWIGVWLAFTQGFLVRKLVVKYTELQLLSVSMLSLSVCIAMLLVPQHATWFYLLNPLVALAHGINAPNLNATISNSAQPHEQGQIMGINQSMLSLGQTIPPVVAGYLNNLNPKLPLLTGSFFVFCAWVVFFFVYKKNANTIKNLN